MEKRWLGSVGLVLVLVLLVFAVGYSSGNSPTGYGFFDKYFKNPSSVPKKVPTGGIGLVKERRVPVAYLCANTEWDIDYDGEHNDFDYSDFTPYAMGFLNQDSAGVLEFRNLQVKLLEVAPGVGPGGSEEPVATVELKNLINGNTFVLNIGPRLSPVWPLPGFENIDVLLMFAPDGNSYKYGEYAAILAVARVRRNAGENTGRMVNGPDPIFN